MADNNNAEHESNSEAKKWFVLAVIGTALYVTAVFTFVINGDLSDSKQGDHRSASAEVEAEAGHGQPH
jgi:hypothetical protein